MTTHVKVLGALFIVFGAIYVLLAFGSSLILGVIAGFVGSQGGDDATVSATVMVGHYGASELGVPAVDRSWFAVSCSPACSRS